MLTTLTIKNARLTATTAGGKRSREVLFFLEKKKAVLLESLHGKNKKKNRRINVNVQNTNGFRKDDHLSCRIGSFLNSGVRTKNIDASQFLIGEKLAQLPPHEQVFLKP